MAIDRSRGGNMVRACVAEYCRRERMCVTITPEGTRKRVAQWKLGFYYIATEANVPIVPVALRLRETAGDHHAAVRTDG